jgi:hypothetical protein
MTTVSIEDPQFQSAIEACAVALRRMAAYEINPTLTQRMHEFAQKRTIEKLEAQTALARLRAALPGLVSDA